MTATFPTAHSGTRAHTSFDARDAIAARLLDDDLLASVDLTLPERTWVRRK